MLKSSKAVVMTAISSLGFATLSTTMVVAGSGGITQRLFRNAESNWIITKQDLESEEDTFSKVITRGNIIEFSKTNNSVVNLTPINWSRVSYTSIYK